MIWTNTLARLYIQDSPDENADKAVCYIKNVPSDILQEIKEYNAEYKKMYGEDFVNLIDGFDPAAKKEIVDYRKIFNLSSHPQQS
ncbi:MAG: hypothetical protein IKO93_16845 [Lentisphaeria bacterium]|nr:hypothetical protein [Lentisphaeria bacterium]